MEERVDSGSELINALLDGGYEKDVVTTIYGPAGSGKTTMCVMCAIKVAEEGKKTIYIDTEGGFSVSRLMQLTPEHKKVLDSMVFLKPTSFSDQKKIFSKLRAIVNEKIGLIVVDTISMLYRIELAKQRDAYEVNRELGEQISFLAEISRKKNIPVLLANQVYSDVEKENTVKMVGGDLLKYSSKCLIELKRFKSKRAIVLVKHRSLPRREAFFEINDKGFFEVTG